VSGRMEEDRSFFYAQISAKQKESPATDDNEF
jgi:hypothetical protein